VWLGRWRLRLAEELELVYLGWYSRFFVSVNLGAKLNVGVGRISAAMAGPTYRVVRELVDVKKDTITLERQDKSR